MGGKQELSLSTVINNHELFSSLFLKIYDKERKLTPLYLNPVQKDIIKNLSKHNRVLVLKARQQGVSTLIQSLLYRLALKQTISALVLSHDDRSTQAFRRMFSNFNDNMPEEFRTEFGHNNRTTISIPATNSIITVATANGTGNVGRGFSLSHLHFSEYAFVNDALPILAGAIQAGNPRVVIESTANGAGDDFYEKCMLAYTEPDKSVWKLLFYQWWHSRDYQRNLYAEELDSFQLTEEEQDLVRREGLSKYQIAWRREKIKELGIKLFNQEYPESVETAFLTSGVGFFADIPHLQSIFTAPTNTEYDSSKTYIAGIDLGKANDYTVVSVFDSTGVEVALERFNNMSWLMIREKIVTILKRWNVKYAWLETNNVGDVIYEQLRDMITSDPEITTMIQTIHLDRINKPKLITYLHSAMDRKEILLLPDPQGKKEIHSFVAEQTPSGNWKYSAKSGHDDTVIARMYANYGLVMQHFVILFV